MHTPRSSRSHRSGSPATTAFGSWIAGWFYEVTGGYSWGFGVAIAAMVIGMAQFWLIEEPVTSRWREERA